MKMYDKHFQGYAEFDVLVKYKNFPSCFGDGNRTIICYSF